MIEWRNNMKRTQKKNIENLEKVFEEKKKFPIEIKERINHMAFKNIVIAAIIIIYFAALYFGMMNISTENYLIILRVISIILLALTIIIFEVGYNKDNGQMWLYGTEISVIAIFSLYLTYLYSFFYANFGSLLLSVSIFCLIYYAIKIIILQRKIEKEYKKSITDIKEIVKK